MTTVLFDLDGTLLPMQQDEFTTAYFDRLSKKLAPHGYDPKRLVDGVWQGTKAMVINNGKQTNEQAFRKEFAGIFGDKVYSDIEKFNEFYETDFDKLKSHCSYNEQANQTIQTLKEKGFTLVLASNPIFPMAAQKKRMLWAGINPDDFALITSYENSHYCKPNPLYYKEIIEKMGVKPGDCLMVGNDTTEDAAAMQVGVDFFLLTDCLLNNERKDISKYSRGSFMQLLSYMVNRTGVAASKYKPVFDHLASWGFIVIGNEDESAGGGASAAASLDYILTLNSDSNSKFYGKIDVDNIGIGGHSQGCLGAINAVMLKYNSQETKEMVGIYGDGILCCLVEFL